MSNFVTNDFRNVILGTGTRVDLDGDTIKAMFLDNADDTMVVGDDRIDDIVSAGRIPAIASCPALASPTIGSVAVGVFDAADTVFTSLSGDQAEQLLLFKDTGTESTSNLICAWDTASGLPLTPNGGNVTVTWATTGIISV